MEDHSNQFTKIQTPSAAALESKASNEKKNIFHKEPQEDDCEDVFNNFQGQIGTSLCVVHSWCRMPRGGAKQTYPFAFEYDFLQNQTLSATCLAVQKQGWRQETTCCAKFQL